MLELIHVVQHFCSKSMRLLISFRINGDFILNLVCVSARHFFISITACFFKGPRTFLPFSIIYFIHSSIVHIITILDSQPRVLLYVAAELFWLETNNVKFGRLFVIYSPLVQD